MAEHRAYLHPYRWTSLGLALLEAMTLGMPVLGLATTAASQAVPAGAGSNGNPDQANVMSQIAASGARFALTTGDTGYPDGSQTVYGDLHQTGSNTSAVFGPSFWPAAGASIPLFNGQGNHGETNTALVNWPEGRAVKSSGGRYQMDVECCQNNTKSASYPSEWYAFNAGPVRGNPASGFD